LLFIERNWVSVAGQSVLVCGALVVFALFGEIARADGKYQTTRDGKTLLWNNNPKRGDVATWSGNRDSDDYASGFGLLTWYQKERGSNEPQLYARYWGRMVDGKLEGPVNVHAKRKTHYAIFVGGTRVTGWKRGTAPLRAAAVWRGIIAKRQKTTIEPAEELRRAEPESPAAGPEEETWESIRDLYSERWPKIDIDDSLRLLAFPPTRLRR
jgi:hypothetical protein